MLTTTFTLEQNLRLETRASPELIAYAGLLAMPAAELELHLERELSANPALEREDVAVCPFCGETLTAIRCATCARPARAEQEPVLPEPSCVDELRPLVSSADLPILEHVLGSLDSRGFLTESPRDIAVRLAVKLERVAAIVEVVRDHGPPGIAAGDLRECLLLQLDESAPAAVHLVVDEHLDDLARGRLGEIGLTRVEIDAAVEFIRTRLSPSASWDSPEHGAPAALPDVIVREEDETLFVEIVEPKRLRVGLARSYVEADRRLLDANERRTLEVQLEGAQTFLHRLHRRWQTMRAVAELVVERQRAFVLGGPRFIAPLTRAEVAGELGMHESTVSRATAGRYVLLPSRSLVPFSTFFDAAQGPCAALTHLVANEGRPASDARLAEQLAVLGYPVARRTVAKYRERLGIPPHTQRRRESVFARSSSARSAVRA
jgi:RNA polymerase sigma-54 factor